MSRKKQVVKGGPSVPRIRENSRLMRAHDSMVDLMNRQDSFGTLLDALAPTLFGLHLSDCWEEDIFYSDDSDDEDYGFYPHYAARKHLEPHPQIKQLTDEEADNIAKQLIVEEKQKGKTQRNKRKKQRKKEKKRLEKESVLKENVAKEDQDKLDSSEDQEPTPMTDGDSGENTDNIQMAAEDDDTKEKDFITEKKKDAKNQKDLNLEKFQPSLEVALEQNCEQKHANTDKRKEKVEKEKPEVVEVKMESEANKKKTLDPTAEDFAKRSIELAVMGNRLAASGQYKMAVRCFTDAIKYNPKEFKLFGNRSLCYERLQQYEKALRDADAALSMEPNWIKGLFRKGKALCGLKRYYEASLVYKDVLKLENTSTEAAQELKRAQTLHLMELGFSWSQSSEALKTHQTLEEAVDALFVSDSSPSLEGASAIWDKAAQSVIQEADDEDDGEWIVQQTTRPRNQQVKDLDSISKSQSLTPHFRNSVKPALFPVWAGTLAPSMTYVKLHELFSRAGTVYSIKMLLEQQSAFVNYTRREDSDRAIQCINGMVVEGTPLTVRYPFKVHHVSSESDCAVAEPFLRSGLHKKECFFWRTTGCTREDCTYRHVPENKNIDREKVTGRLGYALHARDHE